MELTSMLHDLALVSDMPFNSLINLKLKKVAKAIGVSSAQAATLGTKPYGVPYAMTVVGISYAIKKNVKLLPDPIFLFKIAKELLLIKEALLG